MELNRLSLAPNERRFLLLNMNWMAGTEIYMESERKKLLNVVSSSTIVRPTAAMWASFFAETNKSDIHAGIEAINKLK